MKVNAEKTCSRMHNTHLFVCVCMCECMFVFIAAIYCQSSCASNANLRRVGVGVLSPVRRCQPNAHMNEWICVLVCAVFFYSTWLFEIFVCGRVFFNFCLAVLHRHFATQFELCAMPRRFEQTECRVNCCGERGM